MAANQPLMGTSGFEPEIQDISRQRELSKLLLQQGLQGNLQGQMVSGRYVPSHPFEGIANIYSAYKGRQLGKEADEKQAQLAETLRRLQSEEGAAILEKLQGRPAQAEILATPENLPAGQTLLDDMDQKTLVQAARPEVKGSTQAALAEALRGRTQLSQNLATKLFERQFAEPKWEKAINYNQDGSEIHGWVNVNSPNPQSTFVAGSTKPAYTPMDAAKFTWETGLPPPNAPAAKPAGGAVAPAAGPRPVAPSAGAPVAPAGSPAQTSAVVQPAAGGLSGKARQELALDKAKRQEQYREQLPADLKMAENTINIIDKMIGDAEVVDGDWKVKQGGREPHAGFNQFVGATWRPYYHLFEGSAPAGFKSLYKQVKGATFMEAFGRLKGGGQITEVEGAKAEQALNRMDKAQSEAEFIEAAREFQQNLRTGMELAKQKAGMPNKANAPAAPARKAPNTPPAGITQREWDAMSDADKALWSR